MEVVDLDIASLEGFEAVDTAEQGAFSAAGRADDCGNFAAAHFERDAVENAEGAVVFHEVADLDHQGLTQRREGAKE